MRRLIILFVFVVMVAIGQLSAQNLPMGVQEAIANYDYEMVLALMEKEVPTLPLLYQKGRVLKALGDNEGALAVFQTLMVQDSLNPRAYIEAAECCKALVRYNDALNCYQRAKVLNPTNKYVCRQYIEMLLGMKQYREALKESDLLAARDSSLQVLHLQAESLARSVENDTVRSVIAAYQNILECYPQDFLATAKLGNIYIANGEYGNAIRVTELYRQIDSTNLAVNRVNAQAYCLNKSYPEAIRRYEQLFQERDSSFQTCLYAGISYYAVEDFYKVHDILEHARREEPNNVNLLYYLGRACAKTSWKKEGVEYLEQAIGLTMPTDSTMIRLYVGMADCYKMAGRPKDQINTLLTMYEKHDRTRHRLLYDVAFVYSSHLRNSRKAEEYLEAYLRTRPKDLKQEVDADGIPIIGENNRYDAAKAFLEFLQKRRREEEFFKGEQKE